MQLFLSIAPGPNPKKIGKILDKIPGVNKIDDVLRGLKGKIDDVLGGSKSKVDDAFETLGREADDAADEALYWAVRRQNLLDRGFSEQAVDKIMSGRATLPGANAQLHQDLRTLDPHIRNAPESDLGKIRQNQNVSVLESHGYNVINEPSDLQLHDPRVGYQGAGNPDYILDGNVYDCYVPNPKPGESTEAVMGKIWGELDDKVPRQADRIVLDISNLDIDSNDVIAYFDIPENTAVQLEALKEIIIINDGAITGIWTP